jgi:nuclear transport factor 2 (NTF2) superfamily protein
VIKLFVVADSVQSLILKAYDAFNRRDIDTVLSLMHPDVHWPNGWEGGYVEGHEQVRDYWTRQWKELDPHVLPVSFTITPENRVETAVHQIVKDKQGKLLADSIVTHIYSFEDELIKSMEIHHKTP